MTTTTPTRTKAPILLVFDLNGTMVDRVKKDERQRLRLCRWKPDEPDLRMADKSWLFLRPYVDHFVDFALANFHVASWTSAKDANARQMVDCIFGGGDGGSDAHRALQGQLCADDTAMQIHSSPYTREWRRDPMRELEFQWTRSHCITGRQNGLSGHDSIKDMTRIWSNFEGVNVDQRWSQHNTILIDDTAAKLSRTPNNHILLPAYSLSDKSLDCDQDATLLSLQNHLKAMLEAFRLSQEEQTPFSVQTWITRRPLFTSTQQHNGNDFTDSSSSKLTLADPAWLATPNAELWERRHRPRPIAVVEPSDVTGVVTKTKAEKKAERLAQLIADIEGGRVALPPGFVISEDGKVALPSTKPKKRKLKEGRKEHVAGFHDGLMTDQSPVKVEKQRETQARLPGSVASVTLSSSSASSSELLQRQPSLQFAHVDGEADQIKRERPPNRKAQRHQRKKEREQLAACQSASIVGPEAETSAVS